MATVCARMSDGELLQDVARDLGVPNVKVSEWGADDEFREAYARAREMQAHAIATRAYVDAMTATPEDVQAARLRFDAGKWLAAKIAPRHYGEQARVEHAGDPAAPVRVEVAFADDVPHEWVPREAVQ